MVTHERKLAVQKTKVYRSYLKLNEIEKYIAYMEWYKKSSKEMGIGYYDRSWEQASNPDAKPMTEFELYVLNMLENFAVTVDIFLENSSFMHWWNKYKVIVGSNYSSAFTEVMKRKTYRKYADWVSIRTDQ
ncbi:hypothetical protein ACFX2I_045020 [Malus domestica]